MPYGCVLAGGIELENKIYVVTEEVKPLAEQLPQLKAYPNAISWGIYQIAVRHTT